MTSRRNAKRAHILLALYWLYKVLGGSNPLKAAAAVLVMERNSARKQKQEQEPDEGVESKEAAAIKPVCAGLTGSLRKTVLKNAARTFLQKQKVI